MNLFKGNTALVIIDVQEGFDDLLWGNRNLPCAEKNMEKSVNGYDIVLQKSQIINPSVNGVVSIPYRDL